MTRIIPDKIQAGLTFRAAASLPDHSGWDVFLILRGPMATDLDAAADGDEFTITADAAVTVGWRPGEYRYSLRASRAGEVVQIEVGRLTVLPDLAAMPDGYDARSEYRKSLEAIEAVIAKRATLDQERYRINNRELYRTPIADLLKLRAFYAQKVRDEDGCGGGRIQSIAVGFRPMRR